MVLPVGSVAYKYNDAYFSLLLFVYWFSLSELVPHQIYSISGFN